MGLRRLATGRLGRVTVMLATISTVAGALTAQSASAYATASGTCTVTATIQFATPLRATPTVSTDGFNLSGSGTCRGATTPLTAGGMTWNGSGALDPGASCATLVTLFGSANMGIPNAFAQVNFDAAGTAQTQTWVILSTGSLGQFVGVGEFAWSNVSEQTACALSGTSTMTLTGTLIYEA